MAVDIEAPSRYNASELVKFFHSVPHYDIQFEPVKPDFNPEDKSYQESILLIVAVPVIWMLVWILIYMVYFCYFCATCRQRRAEKSHKTARPAKWFSFFFSILALLALTTSIYGNEYADSNVKSADTDLNMIKTNSEKMAIQSAVILHGVDYVQNNTIRSLSPSYRKNGALDHDVRMVLLEEVERVDENLSKAGDLLRDSVQPLMKSMLSENPLSKLLEEYEFYRRVATHVLSLFVILATALSLCALGSRKRGFILACVAIAICNVIFVWAAVGVYMGLSVATADLCMDPAGYINPQKDSSSSDVEKALGGKALAYYLECQPFTDDTSQQGSSSPTASNPFSEDMIKLHRAIANAGDILLSLYVNSNEDAPMVLTNISSAQLDVSVIQKQLLELGTLTGCQHSHRNYMAAVDKICTNVLVGEAAIVGSYLLTGICMIILVFLMYTTARFTGSSKPRAHDIPLVVQPSSRRRAYVEVDSHDNDFQSRDQHNRSDNPLYYRFSQISTTEDNIRVGASSSASAQASAPPRSSPPPAYQNHKDFYSTYGNNGTLDSNTRAPSASNDLNRNSNTFRT